MTEGTKVTAQHLRRRALAQCDFPDAKPARYQPTDELLALLESL